MAGKDKSVDQELDDWAAAIDEWDANLALPAPTGPQLKVDPSELAEPATVAPDDAMLQAPSEAPTEPSPSAELLAAATAPRASTPTPPPRAATPTPAPRATTPTPAPRATTPTPTPAPRAPTPTPP